MLAKDKPVGNVKFGIGLDGFEETLNTLDKVNKAFKVSESSLKTVLSTFDKTGASIDDLAKKQDALSDVTEIQSKKIDILTKRREEYIQTYGQESKQVASVTSQINQATTKYNGYAKQLKETKQSYILASSGVDEYTKAIKDNEKALAEEVKAYKESGDKAGELQARQKGLSKQAELTEKAIDAQKKAIDELAKEFGESSTEVRKAENYLESLQRTASNTGTRLGGVESALGQLSNEAKDTANQVDKAADAIEDAGSKGESAAGGFSAGASALGGLVGGLAASVSTKALDIIIESVGQVTEAFNVARDAQSKLQNQTWFSPEQTKELTTFANELVKSNLVDNLQEGVDLLGESYNALGGKVQDPLQLYDIANRANAVAKTFDGDVNEVIRGATGLSTSFGISIQEAFDYLTAGAKGGLNFSNELFDNIAEYAPQFEQNGISIQDMFKILANGTDAGAYNLDKVNDLVKEFGVRVADGTIKDAVGDIGGSFQDLYTEFEKGNISQQELMTGFSNEIKNVKDETKQATLVSELFGSVGEDNGVRVVSSLGEVRDEYENVNGLALDLAGNLADVTPLEAFKDGISGVVNELGIWATDFGDGKLTQDIQLFFGETVPQWGQNIGDFIGKIVDFGDKFKAKLEEVDPSLETFSGFIEDAGGIINTFVDVALYNLNTGFETLGDFFTETVAPQIVPLLEAFSDKLERAAGFFGGTAEAADKFKTAIDVMWQVVKVRLELMFGLFKFVFGAIGTLIEIIAAGISGTWDTFTALLEGDWATAWDKIKETVGRVFNAIWIAIKDTWVGKILTTLGTFFSDAFKGFTTWTGDVGRDVGGFLDKLVKWFTELPDRIGTAFSNGKETLKKAFADVFNAVLKTVAKPVNGIIGGANWILKKLGADELPTWEPEFSYADGTPDGGHPVNAPMLVNDGRGAEMVIEPDGNAYIPKGKNVVLNGKKGTHVLTAEETAAVTGRKRPTFAYKNGTGFFDGLGDMVNNVKNGIGNAVNGLKNTVGDIFNYATNPAKLVSKVFGSLGLTDGLSAYPLQVGKAIISKATSAMVDKVKGLFESGGNLDLGTGNLGVYKYLADVANQVMAKYSGFVATSGYRAGDPHSHGKRNAIDIAIPGVVNGSPRYKEAANYAFEKFASKVGYVITNGQVRDRSGQSGAGTDGRWKPWADGDHYDHVHINGIKDPQSKQVSGENISGSGVSAFRGVAIRALQMTGQYNQANLNALLNQMRTESNGNARAINLWDSNAAMGIPSKGLMQVIDPTFRSYAMKGYDTNIYDPLSNILASIRYTLARYGSLTAGWRGVGYENGGLITRQHLAMVGEKNRPEMVIPLHSSKRSRAMELLAQAQQKLGVDNQTTVVTTNSDSDLIAQLIQQQVQTNALLQALLAKDSNVYLDKNTLVGKIAPEVETYNARTTSIAARRQGRFA